MTFKDYYSILQLDLSASESEIRAAFKRQALRWHPDKNKGFDTTTRMQEINEAYLILKDEEARGRYDTQYKLFKQKVNTDYASPQANRQYPKNNTPNFESSDEILKKWMENAQTQSVGLAQQLIVELRSAGKRALVGAGEGLVSAVKFYVVVGAIILFFILLTKSCNYQHYEKYFDFGSLFNYCLF